MANARSNESYEEVLSPNLYYDRNFKTEAVKILPGEYYVTSRDMALVTTLGSCVAACILDRVRGIGGMNHFMLPGGADDGSNLLSASARYGTYAMEKMINDLLKMGAKRSHLEAKVFGGGNMLRGFTGTSVGVRNAEFVLNYMRTENIAIVGKDLLDIYPRKVYFFPRSGDVLVKKLRNMHNDTIIEREKVYSAHLTVADVQGEIELFRT